MFTTLIDCLTLSENFARPNWVVIDCRFDLTEPIIGPLSYEKAHIPHALYAHLELDLSNPPSTDVGRHPLPSPEHLRERFSRWGITPQTQVVIYDNLSGAFGARLWWMLRYMGHRAVAVLDGGWEAWRVGGYDTSSGIETRESALFVGESHPELFVTLDHVAEQPLLIDSRDPRRYSGEFENIDARAGHIPDALNYPFASNWDENRLMRPIAQLTSQFRAVFGEIPSAQATFYCGSGVTACFNILAAVHAGFDQPKLYVGSWSEWSKDMGRPIAVGNASHKG